MVWFVLEGSKSRTVTESVSYKGGYRAARAAKNLSDDHYDDHFNCGTLVTKQ